MSRGHFVPLSVSYFDDDRVLDAGHVAETLYTRALALAGRLWENDGFLSRRQVDRLALDLPGEPLAELVRVGLLRPDDSDPYRPGYRIRSWLEWNSSAEQIRRGRDRDASRKRDERASKRTSRPRPDGVRLDASGPSAGVQAPEADAVAEADAAAAAEGRGGGSSRPEEIGELAGALLAAGLPAVDWNLTAEHVVDILGALDRVGQRPLVEYALRAYRKDAPARSARAWVGGWRELRPRPTLVAAVACGLHPSAALRDGECSACWSDRLTADEEATS